jgi:hypothetical protein
MSFLLTKWQEETPFLDIQFDVFEINNFGKEVVKAGKER